MITMLDVRLWMAIKWELLRLEIAARLCLLAVDVINATGGIYPEAPLIAYRSIARTIGKHGSTTSKSQVLRLNADPHQRRQQKARWN